MADTFLDRSRMNPREIASRLKDINCPFACQYIDYRIELVYKKRDPTIGPDNLKLTFHLDEESSWQTTLKDLDYTPDMLASDYGAIFGLLVGLSLIDTMVYFLAALKSFVHEIKQESGQLLKLSYDLVKWSLIATSVALLIILTFSTDFQNLSIFLPPEESLAHADESEFLNSDTGNANKVTINNKTQMLTIQWGPETNSTSMESLRR